jgi:GH15 family glucan-1,4-alpha-glucosidase
MHVYEQLDRNTGAQYNAEDLTWSYAEILGAMRERTTALELRVAA